MEINALDNLIKAFEIAPSAELAKVIYLELISHKKFIGVERYISAAKDVLTPEEFIQSCEALYEEENYQVALGLLDQSIPTQALLIAKCKMHVGQMSEAQEIYLSSIKKEPLLASSKLERLFELTNIEDTSSMDSKPKLQVVEKVNFAEVTELIRYRQETTDFNDVVGLDNIKKQINKKIIMPFQRPGLFERFKKKIGGGVLIYGPPGCGKTLLARATAGECKASFYNVEISDVLDMYIGESEQKLHAIFEKARTETPCVLFFDEIEALAGKREHSRNSTSANLVSQFLTELDGFSQNNKGILVLASTNVPWSVDAAFLRPGRFDRMFFVPPPDSVARKAILEHHMKERPSEGNINFSAVAAKTAGYSGADLYNLVEMAADEAIDDSIESGNETKICSHHFEAAMKDARSTTVEWLTTARNYARYANDGGRYDEVLSFLKQHGK